MTRRPVLSSAPENSRPTTTGGAGIPGYPPLVVMMSAKLRPPAVTRTSVCPGLATGSGDSLIDSAWIPERLERTSAFMLEILAVWSAHMNSEGRERWLLTPTSAIASRTAAAPIAVHARKSMSAWSSPKVRRIERVKASAAFAVRDVGIDSLRGEEVKTSGSQNPHPPADCAGRVGHPIHHWFTSLLRGGFGWWLRFSFDFWSYWIDLYGGEYLFQAVEDFVTIYVLHQAFFAGVG